MAVNYRALPRLRIDNAEPPSELMEDILEVIVEESLHQPGMFTLVLKNSYQPGKPNSQPWKHQDVLKIGKPITIGFSPSTDVGSDSEDRKAGDILEGEITAIETHFTERTQAPIVIRGYDVSHRLHRGVFNRSFQNMTDSDIVKKIVEEVGISIKTLDDSGIVHAYVFQQNQTNMEFLRERAARIGFELFIQDGKLYFRKPKSEKTLDLKWLRDIRNFRVRVTSAEQVKEVEVRGWDYGNKRPIIATANTEKLITSTDQTQAQRGSSTSTAFNNRPSNPKMIMVDRPVFQPKEADLMAQSICDELGGQFVYADAEAEGSPEIRPGRVVELTDLGPHTGKYYITETRHVYTERIYSTEFSVRGLRSGDLLTTLAPPHRPQPGQTFLVGIVTDNEDPEGWGRVKVKFPTLTEDHASNWARVVSIGAGNQRGFDCLPEIDDEVLVAFEHGDIHRPYILGGVWNGQDAPPNSINENVQNSKVRLRTFKTRTGHQIQFIEEDNSSKAGVCIETTKGHKIYLNDSDGSISIQSTGDLKIEANGNISITAGGVITVRGSLIKLN
ncbi:MAG: VgrG-related protein [Leptolyngbyaceae cyanobacterium bins.302]|nr:VgrG-related protein [Leptolyngbyaceae cyanobacterium bins.302]